MHPSLRHWILNLVLLPLLLVPGTARATWYQQSVEVGEMRYGTTHGYQSQVFSGWHMALYPPAKNLEWMRPMTAVGAVAVGDRKFGRFIAQALDPIDPSRLSFSELWAFEWSWLTPKGPSPTGGLIAVAGDVVLGERWWFLHTDGLWTSPDGGKSRIPLLDSQGRPLRGEAFPGEGGR